MAEVVREILVQAGPETIWPFLTDPDRHVEWNGTQAELDPRPGGTYRVNVAGRYGCSGEFVEVVPMERVVFTFGWDEPGHPVGPASTTVAITLVPEGAATRVRLVHSGLPDEAVANHRRGWDHYLDRLATRASGGDVGPDRGPWGETEPDLLAIHTRALAATGAVVERIAPAQLGDPTPCAGLDVRGLLGHLVGGNARFLAVAQGLPGTAVPLDAEVPDGDWASAYRASAAALVEAWRAPGVLGTTVELPLGRMPAAAALGMHVVETVVHGWDLATSTRQPAEVEPELCAAAWQLTRRVDDSLRGPGRPFGEAVEAPADASPTVQLMAWLGRRA